MNDAVVIGGLAMFASTGFIVVVALTAAALLGFFEKRIDHGEH
ncbi:hypothetical protein P886_1876 [Alteromonadaceae bacterium 2753L.S.0a.02]|nr:hypothetical protein P886_1876 [Alteromonadaceae bacterium 2753L.S.0a.02]